MLVLFHYSVSTAEGLSPPGSALPSTLLFFFCLQYFFPFSFCWACLWASASLHCLLYCTCNTGKTRIVIWCHMCMGYVTVQKPNLCVFVNVYAYIKFHAYVRRRDTLLLCTTVVQVCILYVCTCTHTQGSQVLRINTGTSTAVFECIPL